jgi:tetratricopeptide (TPR) repeat protein
MRGAKMWRLGMCGLLAAVGLLVGADAPPTKPTPPKPPWQRLLQGDDARKARQLEERLEQLQSGGQFEDALKAAEELAALRKRLQGEDHWEVVDAQHTVAAMKLALRAEKADRENYAASFAWQREAAALRDKGRYRQVQPLLEKVLAVRREVLGEKHPDTATAYNNVAFNLNAQGKFAEAAEGYQKALAIRRELLGEDHPETAGSYNNVAYNLWDQGKYREAEEGHRKALAIDRRVLGEEHPDTARCYHNLATSLYDQGRYREAEDGLKKALKVRLDVLGEAHLDTASSYNAVANNLRSQGRYQEAEAGFRKSLDIRLEVLGEHHPGTAIGYSNVAYNLHLQGRYQEAEEGFQKALDIWREVLGEEHPNTAAGYNMVAANLNAQRRYPEAEKAYRKALRIYLAVHGQEHPNTAGGYNNLALNLTFQGRYPEAKAGFEKALDIWRKVLGEEHVHTAAAYQNIAYNLDLQGRLQEAEKGYRKALAIKRKLLGEEHPEIADSCNSIALNLHDQGRYREAEEMYSHGAELFLAARLRIAAGGLQRAARTSERSPLLHFAALLARNGKPAEAWDRLEQGLGRGTWDDLSARLRRPAKEQARQTELAAKLERLDQLLARHSAVEKPSAEQEKEREALLRRRREAREELNRFAQHLEETYGPAQGQVFGRSQIQAALPADTALIAWIDLPAGRGAADPRGEHWAVLLRSRGEPVFQRLDGSGPGGEWTEEDIALPLHLRNALQKRRDDWQRLARRLADQRLRPLGKHLAADAKVPAVRHLIALPSTALAGVPLEVFGAEYTVSYASSGTLYAYLRKQRAVKSAALLAVGDPVFEPATGAAKERPLPPGGVLVTLVQPGSSAAESKLRPGDVLLKYGDVELKTPADLKTAAAEAKAEVQVEVWRAGKTFQRELRPGALGVVLADKPAPKALAERYRLDRQLSARRGDDRWMPLPGTRVEVESLRRLFGAEAEPKVLLDSDASEQKLDEMASTGELGKYRYVHLATHGEVDDAWPLRSAVILSRDTLPEPQQQLLAGKPAYDGRLTAEEILRHWNLEADLVTLSACQTALGKYERGEGFVGFAQALILCGSRSVCLSLWKVDDAATALLMQRFYANLLAKRDGLKAPLPKAAALREAKEWLRNLSRSEALRVAAEVSQGVERSKGRPKVKLLPALPEPAPPTRDDKPYAHPYYWAAFILIGDPN